MKSQVALFTFLLLSVCLANAVSAQTHYHQNLMVRPQAVVYPQTQPIRGWIPIFRLASWASRRAFPSPTGHPKCQHR